MHWDLFFGGRRADDHPLPDLDFGRLRLAGNRDRDAFRRALVAPAGRLRHAVDPDGAFAAVFLHDAVDGQ